ncbi:hypothetical protein VTL71DRAFT_2538 [Oculimacula yallundae]|uniref:SWIM-type domain-containing protein n=1 Tax=Oculimacula yallundae TaxID=86028 RepID=A0ABR4CAB9_9HELO
MTSSLPSTRTLLTSLFNTLTTPSPNPQADTKPVNEPYDASSNPLKALPASQKALLSTMHVLFTPPMLLQALDLLDRGLVVRVVEKTRNNDGAEENGGGGRAAQGGEIAGEVFPPQATIHLPPSSPTPANLPNLSNPPDPSKSTPTRKRTPTIHQVRSSQPPKSRFRDASSTSTANGSSSASGSGSGTGSIVYTVRLEAWNCSCAAFAFASFPVESVYPRVSAWDLVSDSQRDHVEGGEEEEGGIGTRRRGVEGERGEDEEWEFGGLSRDGKGSGTGGGGGVPCCKHLLACILGERWDLLRGYVKERIVGQEEMAGLGCEG